MQDIKIASVEELLANLEKINSQFGKGKNSFIFRGQQNSSYTLLPGIYREFAEPQKSRLIAGGSIEGKVYRSSENEILTHFKKEACSVINSVPLNDDFTWLQYAQHYGVPTRLLDFTGNPLIALYFCCRGEMQCDGAVWVLNYINYRRWMLKAPFCKQFGEELTGESIRDSIIRNLKGRAVKDSDRIEMERPWLFVPAYIDLRMRAQDSRFLLWGTDERPLEKMISKDEEMNLDPQGISYGIADDTRFLSKIIIPGSCKHDILKKLDMLGVNEKTAFPGLDGIGKYIERFYRKHPDDVLEYMGF